jgi:biotin carboxyl carrier protein
MIYEVFEKKGPRVRIDLREISDGQYELTVEGKTVLVDAKKSGRTIYSVIEEGLQYEAIVDESGTHGFDVLVAGRQFHLEAVDERSVLLSQASKHVTEGPQTVIAEMPGKVVKIEVAVGDTVQENQGVVVVEAMKMENEIRSPIEGTVKEIAVQEGQTVETGTLLFTIEPPPAAS